MPGDYHEIDTRKARIVLIEAAPAVLARSTRSCSATPKLGSNGWASKSVAAQRRIVMDDDSITVRDSDGVERIPARRKVWAAGVKASPLAGLLARATGAETDRAGRIAVEPDCTLPGHPEVFAIGDMVSLNGLPGVAQPAIQEGKYVGKGDSSASQW